MTELFSFQGARDRTLCPAVSAAWEIVSSLTNPVKRLFYTLKIKVLQKFSDWIQDATLFSYLFKWISANWVKGLYKLASGVEDILDQVFKVFGFLDTGTIGKI